MVSASRLPSLLVCEAASESADSDVMAVPGGRSRVPRSKSPRVQQNLYRGPARLAFGWLFGRNLRIAGRGLFQVGFYVRAGVAYGPADSSTKQIQEEFILPIVRAVADGGVEN